MDILWSALRALDACTDPRSESPPMRALREEMVHAILELELSGAPPEQSNVSGAAEPVPIDAGRRKKKPNDAA